MSQRNRHNTRLGARLTAARDGLASHLPKGLKSLKVGDKVYTIDELDQTLAGFEGKFLAAADAHSELTKLVNDRDAVAPPSRELLADFKAAMVHLLGRKNPLLLKFGLKPEREARRSRPGKGQEAPAPDAKPAS